MGYKNPFTVITGSSGILKFRIILDRYDFIDFFLIRNPYKNPEGLVINTNIYFLLSQAHYNFDLER